MEGPGLIIDHLSRGTRDRTPGRNFKDGKPLEDGDVGGASRWQELSWERGDGRLNLSPNKNRLNQNSHTKHTHADSSSAGSN